MSRKRYICAVVQKCFGVERGEASSEPPRLLEAPGPQQAKRRPNLPRRSRPAMRITFDREGNTRRGGRRELAEAKLDGPPKRCSCSFADRRMRFPRMARMVFTSRESIPGSVMRYARRSNSCEIDVQIHSAPPDNYVVVQELVAEGIIRRPIRGRCDRSTHRML